MHYRALGRTGLNVSVLSLGSGGPNQFGQLRYVPRGHVEKLVRCALQHGINLFDSAVDYARSESILGRAMAGIPRDRYYLSSKIDPLGGNGLLDGAQARRLVERSLKRLRVDELDILCLHKVLPEHYEETVERLAPVLHDLRARGLIRCIGISESTGRDPAHDMLVRALQDDLWDVAMVGYGISRRSAEQEVLPMALQRNVGVVAMVAARDLVTRTAGERVMLFGRAMLGMVASPSDPRYLPGRLKAAFSSLRRRVANGESSSGSGLAIHVPGSPAASYAYAISHPAVATVLTGTNSVSHLDENVAAVLAPDPPRDTPEVHRQHFRQGRV